MTDTPEIAQLTTRLAYENKWLRVREDTVRRADGSTGLYGVVERREFVIVAALADGCLSMVEQFRYPIGRRLWELPMGTCEPGADPATTAAAELREETGLLAARMDHVGILFQGPGYSDQFGHLFLATVLTPGPHSREPSEQGMTCRAVPVPVLEAMIRDGAMQDGVTLAAFAMLRVRGLI